MTCILFVCLAYVWYMCPMCSVRSVFVQACHMCDNAIYMQCVWHMCVVICIVICIIMIGVCGMCVCLV